MRAPIAARIASAWVGTLEPKPPPTCLQTTRTFPVGRFSVRETAIRQVSTICVEVWISSRSPDHCAMVPCGSIGFTCSYGVV